jgi:hypothetical protein
LYSFLSCSFLSVTCLFISLPFVLLLFVLLFFCRRVFHSTLRSKLAQSVTYIREVPGSNPIPETYTLKKGFSWFSSVALAKYRGSTINGVTAITFHIISNIIHCHSTLHNLSVWYRLLTSIKRRQGETRNILVQWLRLPSSFCLRPRSCQYH